VGLVRWKEYGAELMWGGLECFIFTSIFSSSIVVDQNSCAHACPSSFRVVERRVD
jgi:hypothetical protein